MGESRSLNAHRKHVDPDPPVGDGEIEIVAVQTAFPREITAEIEGIIASLEAD